MLLSHCCQGLADQLRLNTILTSVNLKDQNMCDAKVKAGQTAALWAEAAGASYVNCQLTTQVVQSTSSLPLPHANSAGPRRRLSSQQERDKSQPPLQRIRRRGPQGSGAAVIFVFSGSLQLGHLGRLFCCELAVYFNFKVSRFLRIITSTLSFFRMGFEVSECTHVEKVLQ